MRRIGRRTREESYVPSYSVKPWPMTEAAADGALMSSYDDEAELDLEVEVVVVVVTSRERRDRDGMEVVVVVVLLILFLEKADDRRERRVCDRCDSDGNEMTEEDGRATVAGRCAESRATARRKRATNRGEGERGWRWRCDIAFVCVGCWLAS